MINSNNTGSISFDNDSYSVNIVNRRANRSFVGEYGWYDSYWREDNSGRAGKLRIKIYDDYDNLISDGFLYK
ncbi:hypothetical protein [Mesotoga sp.]|uniref:hypothetical protein n=1 Tax=Mesotoga sp. TaxID=2053577 RepID=UPI00345E1F68